jgi:hypothetical protein
MIFAPHKNAAGFADRSAKHDAKRVFRQRCTIPVGQLAVDCTPHVIEHLSTPLDAFG